MRHNGINHKCVCVETGEPPSNCFNELYRMKFGYINDALPGGNAFTDIDAATMINGHMLYIEWKHVGSPQGRQRQMFEQLATKRENEVILVNGDPGKMRVTQYARLTSPLYRKLEWKNDGIEGLKKEIKNFGDRAMKDQPENIKDPVKQAREHVKTIDALRHKMPYNDLELKQAQLIKALLNKIDFLQKIV